jgi:hypothetical protein
MPKKNTTTKPAPATTTEPGADTAALPPAAQIVLALLQPENPTTTAELCDRTGLARSTVTKALAALLDKNLATRQDGGHDGARRIPDRWFATPAATRPPVPVDVAGEGQSGADAPDGNSSAPAAGKVDGDSESAPDREGTGGDETNADAATVADAATAEAPQAEAIPAAQQGDGEADSEDAVSTEPGPQGEAVGDSPAEAQTNADAATPAAHGAAHSEAGEQSRDESDAVSDPGSAPVAPEGEATAPRLGKGALRAMVEAHLRENPGKAWTPSAISKVLGRSAGAINNACLKLTEDGSVTTFGDKPIRFQYTGDASADASCVGSAVPLATKAAR